jgi:hypothetical protein
MANNNSITTFKEGFLGGTRANRFVVEPIWPTGINVPAEDSSFKMVSASLPASTMNTISVPYRGRLINFAGDRMYAPWNVGIYDDNNTNSIWKGLHQWAEFMDGHYTHKVKDNDFSYKKFQTTWRMKQLDANGLVLKTITLYKCWPSVVDEISLNMAEPGFVGFSTTLTFDYIKIQDKENYNR